MNISGLYPGTAGARRYREVCEERCQACPYKGENGCRIDEHYKKTGGDEDERLGI